MEEMPGPLDRSCIDMATTMAADIGPVTSQNSPHLFKEPLLSTSFKSLLMSSGYPTPRLPSILESVVDPDHPVV